MDRSAHRDPSLIPLQNPATVAGNSLASLRWPTIDGPLGLSEEESETYARRFYKFGFLLLPWLWAVNCFYFWPVLRHARSFPSFRRYVVRSAIGFTIFTILLSSWALTFSIGGEQLFGPVWDKLVMYNVADELGLTGWIYAVSGAGALKLSSSRASSVPCVAPSSSSGVGEKVPLIRAQNQDLKEDKANVGGRRAALLGLAAALVASSVSTSSANAGVIEEYLERSKANKELNDKKRLATSGANFARAYTVQFGTCKFPENFTGCQDLAKQKKVPFISDDLELECEGKDKYKCGSNVFWKW